MFLYVLSRGGICVLVLYDVVNVCVCTSCRVLISGMGGKFCTLGVFPYIWAWFVELWWCVAEFVFDPVYDLQWYYEFLYCWVSVLDVVYVGMCLECGCGGRCDCDACNVSMLRELIFGNASLACNRVLSVCCLDLVWEVVDLFCPSKGECWTCGGVLVAVVWVVILVVGGLDQGFVWVLSCAALCELWVWIRYAVGECTHLRRPWFVYSRYRKSLGILTSPAFVRSSASHPAGAGGFDTIYWVHVVMGVFVCCYVRKKLFSSVQLCWIVYGPKGLPLCEAPVCELTLWGCVVSICCVGFDSVCK